ncbi:MAG: TIGR03960 family B12-binding radical SAM protein [Polyangiaceae bacterium]|nr:TIGR03960 family B12-binding radical SAM protein [Polyangiaceae bacterium]
MTDLFEHPYASFLANVTKPNRYTGSEFGATKKEWDSVDARICLAFPDIYDIGMSHLGYRILYKIFNDHPRMLAERCYTPWIDLLDELEKRDLPLASLESVRPLADFDVVGFSLQFELTYTNILLMLDKGGIPLRAADRKEEDPLVIAGGPVATHAEPLAPFIDAILVGDGEEASTEIALSWVDGKKAGKSRQERLKDLAKLTGVYVPSLYPIRVEPLTGIAVVEPSPEAGVPYPIERRLVPDINDYPFPDEFPVGGPEAIFDRMSIEVARGCTEGCRFCQAGMIYRPVRERDPKTVVATVKSALEKSGQDEVSLTALSTADVSCISPMIKKLVEETAPDRVSLSVASLRAYGLSDDLLEDMRTVRTAGLTFAPEAGTQRMRDVINKNVTEEQLLETANRVFSKGFDRMKLYFILGLPTEEDEDVLGIASVGRNALKVGKSLGKRPKVNVSVSVHVPKPHTPFQWCAMDDLGEVDRKQRMLLDEIRQTKGLGLKLHDSSTSELEGVLARGDRRLADVIERAYRNGARFDSWSEHFKKDVWLEAFAHFNFDTAAFLTTLPLEARLPWDHIDVGLEEGFLAREYRKALNSRLSPPCGKAKGMFIHHTNVAEAKDDQRKLICYDCGIACDLTRMREQRVGFLDKMGAQKPGQRVRLNVLGAESPVSAEPTKAQPTKAQPASSEPAKAQPASAASATETPSATQSPEETGSIEANGAEKKAEVAERPKVAKKKKAKAPEMFRPPQVGTPVRVRLGYRKTGPMALLGHLDFIRELPRVIRRAGARTAYTQRFHPKPDMSFAPALALGIASLDEYIDIKLLDPPPVDELLERLNQATSAGLEFTAATFLGHQDPGLAKLIDRAGYLLAFSVGTLQDLGREQFGEDLSADQVLERWVQAFDEAEEVTVVRNMKGIKRKIAVKEGVEELQVGGAEERATLSVAGLIGDLRAIKVFVPQKASGAVRSREIVEGLTGSITTPHVAIRTSLTGGGESLMNLPAHQRLPGSSKKRAAEEAALQ